MNEINASLKVAVKAHYDYQYLRIQIGNRLGMKKDGGDINRESYPIYEDDRQILESYYKNAKEMEEGSFEFIKSKIKSMPIWKDFLKDIKGVGPTMTAVIVSEIDIYIATTVSKIWKFSGVHTVDGLSVRPVKGQKNDWNKYLRSKLLGVLGPSFLRSNSPYREYYDNYKFRKQSAGWGKSDMHRHRAALRYMVKMFLRDLYIAWRGIEGLSIRPPYCEEYLGKKHEQAIEDEKSIPGERANTED